MTVIENRKDINENTKNWKTFIEREVIVDWKDWEKAKKALHALDERHAWESHEDIQIIWKMINKAEDNWQRIQAK